MILVLCSLHGYCLLHQTQQSEGYAKHNRIFTTIEKVLITLNRVHQKRKTLLDIASVEEIS